MTESQSPGRDSSSGRFLRLRKNQILEGIVCLLQMGAEPQLQVRSSAGALPCSRCSQPGASSGFVSPAGPEFLSSLLCLSPTAGERRAHGFAPEPSTPGSGCSPRGNYGCFTQCLIPGLFSRIKQILSVFFKKKKSCSFFCLFCLCQIKFLTRLHGINVKI